MAATSTASTSPTASASGRQVTSRPGKEPMLVGAVDLARAAACQVADTASDVGEHLGATVDSERLVSHRFAANMPGYVGWAWVVTLARVPRGRTGTVCEVELLPGDQALLAPSWLPWDQRLRPGDIGPGDVLPFKADDPRLEPGYTPTGDEQEDAVAIGELALARARVLSPLGLEQAAQRWYRGGQGPTSAGSLRSAAGCMSCGFMIPLAGSMGQIFGVCANEWSPDDGKVVSLDHGCGAHSQTDTEHGPSQWPDDAPIIDELAVEVEANSGARGAGVATATATDAGAGVVAEGSPAGAEADG